jgi:DNA-binding transcriptional ArsR family regulator
MQLCGCIIASMDVEEDKVFKALADAGRRLLLDRLHADNGQTLGQLCEHLDMSRQAVTKHLTVLEEANLIVVIRRGREKLHYLNPVPIHEIADRWIGKFDRGRLRLLADLKQQLEGQADD